MKHDPGFYKRFLMLVFEHDLVRGALALVMMILLWIGGLPIGLVVLLPLMTYAGLRLLSNSAAPSPPDAIAYESKGAGTQAVSASSLEALRASIAAHADQIPDEAVASQFRAVMTWIDRCVAVIVEDGKQDEATQLRGLIAVTGDLLKSYAKASRRGLVEPGTHLRIRQNLATLELEYQRLWERLNRDAIVDLEALSETISTLMRETPVESVPLDSLDSKTDDLAQSDDGALPALPEKAHEVERIDIQPTHASVPHQIRAMIASFTVREMEVLCHIASGRTDRVIADVLFISPRTVAKHAENVRTKLDVSNRTEAAAFAVRYGICLSPGDSRR